MSPVLEAAESDAEAFAKTAYVDCFVGLAVEHRTKLWAEACGSQ